MNPAHSIDSGRRHVAASMLFVLALFATHAMADMATAGWIEKAMLYPHGLALHAKLDTGAETSSLNAPKLHFFEVDGDRWVRFRVTSREGMTAEIEALVVREASIKRHFGGEQIRPVIRLDICIGNIRRTREVNLVDRTGLEYQLLIGRNFLENNLLIDSGGTYLLSPECPD